MLKDKIKAENLNLYYGEHHALKDVSMNMKEQAITALIGPSGCGKSTFLKTLNRMNDLIPSVKIDGSITINEENIYDPRVDVTLLRKKVGMVFQQPNPFPMSIYDNITYGPKIHGIKSKERLDEIVEKSLKGAALWEEVKDRLKKPALGMSGGQQQRVAIARAIVNDAPIILADEPTGNLDTKTSIEVMEFFVSLNEKAGKTIILVTHEPDIAQYSKRIVRFKDGKIVSDKPREEAFAV